jgi:phosphomannomutase/phosphoglucomutase
MNLSGDFPHEIFKAYDIRGIVDKTLTEDIVFLIGRAVGSEVIAEGGTQIVIGRDGRLSGKRLSAALSRGLQASGVDVIDVGVAPSPVVYFSSYAFHAPSCIAITGSHNPPEYNGLKMVVNGVTLSTERIQKLKERILSQQFSRGHGAIEKREVIDDYIARIVSDVRPQRNFKMVIDCGNGVAGITAPQIFKQLGCEVIELFSEVDGTFPNHHPDPSQLENLQDLIQAVKEHDADFGFAFDGDADRLGVVNKTGDVIWPDRQMILFAQDILVRHPGAEIIFDVKCSRNLPIAIEQAGGIATMWRTGHSFMKAKLKSGDAALAGEMSGHIFFKERWFGFDDGVYAGARLVEILASFEESPQAIFAALPNSINTPELRIDFAEGQHYAFMDKLIESADFGTATVNTIDGLRVDFDDGFGLVRPSNTTPILVLRFEADSQTALQRIQKLFAQALRHIDADVQLPF